MRVARQEDGSLVVSRVAPGRGAWLCRDPGTGGPEVSCLEAAQRRNAFARAFRADVPGTQLALQRASPPESENMEPRSTDTAGVTESTEKGLTQ